MTPLKLMSHSGDVLGAVIVPEPAWVLLNSGKDAVFHYVPPPTVRPMGMDAEISTKTVALMPYYRGDGSVTLTSGDLWTFEKIPGCIFIPGFAYSRRGCR